jgi:hypothetical protein
MSGKGLGKERVLEDFEDEERALYEWIRFRQVVVVPDKLALQSWKANREPAKEKENALNRSSEDEFPHPPKR